MSDVSAPSDIIGKKIFFLYPAVAVVQQIIPELVQEEFEVYSSKNYAALAHTLEKYPDAIVFVNIDEGIAEAEWAKWIGELTGKLPNINIGIFSSNSDEALKNKYLNELKVKCGYLILKLDMNKSIGKVVEILNGLNAKGRRKFIRAAIEGDANATLNIPHGNDFVHGNIKDISVVGISCTFDKDPELTKNALLKNIQVKLQSTLLKVEAVVFGSRMMNEQEKVYVLILSARTDPEVRKKIRTYVQACLQSKMDKEIN
jgi:hypothetical protein